MAKSRRARTVVKRRRTTRSSSSTSSGMRRMRSAFDRASRVARSLRRAGKRRSKKRAHELVLGGGGSSSACYVRMKPGKYLKGMKATTNVDLYMYAASGRMTCNTGKQEGYIVGDGCDSVDLWSISQKLSANTANGYKSNLFLLRGCTVETRFTNQDKGNVEIILYDLTVRRDVTVADQGALNPLSAWSTGLTEDASGSSTTVAARTNLGSTPFDSKLFTQYYKVMKTTKLILSQGASHIHKVHIKGSRMMDAALVNREQYLRGLTHLTIAVVNGFPLNDQTTKTNVTTGVAAVDFVTTVRIQYQGWYNNLKIYTYDDTALPSVTAYVMDKGSGEAEADAAA